MCISGVSLFNFCHYTTTIPLLILIILLLLIIILINLQRYNRRVSHLVVLQYAGLTLSRYRSTISRPQKVHTHFPGREATAGTEEEDEEIEDGE